MKLILQSKFPFPKSGIGWVPLLVYAAIVFAAFIVDWALGVFMACLLAACWVLDTADRAIKWRCPNCHQRALKTVGSGGLWDENFKEERVLCGECAACGQQSTRSGLPVLSRWRAFQVTEQEDPSAAH